MNTQKTLSATPAPIGQDSDIYGLWSDMLEPSPRYSPSPPVPIDAANTSTEPNNDRHPLGELRLPKRKARIGFNTLLD